MGQGAEADGALVDYYPVSLDVAGRPCLVVGGGPVAARKVRGLLGCGAVVTVIAPQLCAEMEALTPLVVARRPYARGDVASFRLVVTATGIPDVDAAVFADGEAADVWVNSADDRANCSFILPSVHRDGAVTIAVSTGGLSPALATWVRGRLAEPGGSGQGLGELSTLLGQARARLKAAGVSTETVDWAGLLNGPLPVLVREGRVDEAMALIDDALSGQLGGLVPPIPPLTPPA